VKSAVDDLDVLWETRENHKSRDALVEHWFDLARSIAGMVWKKHRVTFTYDELLSFAMEGLWRAVDNYDHTGNESFKTHASAIILNKIRDGMRAYGPSNRHGRMRYSATFTDVGFYDDDDGGSIESRCALNSPITALRKSTNPVVENLERDHWWEYVLRGLSEVDKQIIMLYYRYGFTMKEVGKLVGLSETRVSQMVPVILTILRKKLVGEYGGLRVMRTHCNRIDDLVGTLVQNGHTSLERAVPGPDLAKHMEMHRSYLVQLISRARAEGYEIKSKRGIGYWVVLGEDGSPKKRISSSNSGNEAVGAIREEPDSGECGRYKPATRGGYRLVVSGPNGFEYSLKVDKATVLGILDHLLP